MAAKIQIRRDTAANWTSADSVLAIGEMGYETDTGKLKFGDGITAWTSLDYFTGDIDSLKAYFDTIYAPVLGADENYVTDAEKVVIGNTSGTNTGDQDLSGLQGKALTTGKIWKGVGGLAEEVDPPTEYAEAPVQVKTVSFTAVGGIPYRVEGSSAITVTVPVATGDRVSIVNASTAITTVGALGDLASGDSCVLYYSSGWKEYTNRLT